MCLASRRPSRTSFSDRLKVVAMSRDKPRLSSPGVDRMHSLSLTFGPCQGPFSGSLHPPL